ncbi:Dicer-like protein 2 [Ophidiomyces ophidiicola]|nr:Dicer-like protein 2 [Ophidiomyces ophidiicola]
MEDERSSKRQKVEKAPKMPPASTLNDAAIAAEEPRARAPRSYQLEMLDASLQGNVIVAMDTGSGKTEIAILRIEKELATCPPQKVRRLAPCLSAVPNLYVQTILTREQLVWFLAPTVALTEQQYTVITAQLPAFQARILTGADNVDHWSTKKIWDGILLNIRILVSTPQVLLDALSNGFVRLNRIALLVFDEAHRCIRNAPANKIMRDFYHYGLQQKGDKEDLPHVLGLTASPVTKADRSYLKTLEDNLNATCVTPKIHRDEMMQFVHLPQFYNIEYQIDIINYPSTSDNLDDIINRLDIWNDPYVKAMQQKNDARSRQKLSTAMMNNKTPCLDQLRRCRNTLSTLLQELGPWAADTFLAKCIKQLKDKNTDIFESNRSDWDKKDDLYISEALLKIPMNHERDILNTVPEEISTKCRCLITFLQKEHSKSSIGIIFAKERATVTMLAHLIKMHPHLEHIRAAAFLGNSAYMSRKSDITELHKSNEQKTTITDLRAAKINLIVTTAVLEEGIDIPVCDVVISFDLPSDLRSYIQRRGRARKKDSKFALFVSSSDVLTIKHLHSMEDAVKQLYLENQQRLQELRILEEVEESSSDNFRIESTGALLTFENVIGHLFHFCATHSWEFTVAEPDFFITIESNTTRSAKVVLPSFVDPKLRVFHSVHVWKTEKMAKRDAAFQAYVALYQAGLVNEHLMPAHRRKDDEGFEQQIEKRPSFAMVSDIYNPWAKIARIWQNKQLFYTFIVDIQTNSKRFPPMMLILPAKLPCDFSFKIFWNEETTMVVSVKRDNQRFSAELIEHAATTTSILLSSLYSQKMISDNLDFSWLFVPPVELTDISIKEWCESVTGTINLSGSVDQNPVDLENLGLVRRLDSRSRPCVFEKYVWREYAPEVVDGVDTDEKIGDQILHIEGLTWPKRKDFLHPVANLDTSKSHHTAKCCHAAKDCFIDKLPAHYSQFTLFIPCIIHNVENYLIAGELAQTLLSAVRFNDVSLVLTAISSSVAREAFNYQRLEFFGDSLLKLYTSLSLAAQNPFWPEGLLSNTKSLIVSNGYLAKAAVRAQLDKFILTKPFSGAKWRPSYNTDFTASDAAVAPSREMSTKVLADVVEALIGAASVDGGHEKALRCLQIFLSDINWCSVDECLTRLNDVADDSFDTWGILPELERLLGYKFLKKTLLLAAVTHPSSRTSGQSYQRLEFVGDAVLDNIIVEALFNSPRQFAHYDMHLMRTALVNADFLAFLCMNTYVELDRGEVLGAASRKITIEMTKQKTYLWTFMRHAVSWDISQAQQSATKQHQDFGIDITQQLCSSQTYPWSLLSRLSAAKFFSDIIESILGAIFIDSRGSMDACRIFLQRIGLMSYLGRVLTEDIDFMHPKQRLGQLANTLPVRYETKSIRDQEGERWECTVWVADEEIVRIDNGVSGIEAETRAADAAVAILRADSESRSSYDAMSE